MGLDVHKETISPALAYPGRSKPESLGVIANTKKSILNLVHQLSPERGLLTEWRDYYNRARLHSFLGPNVPEPVADLSLDPGRHRHRIPSGWRLVSTPVLGGLHHDYRLARSA